MSLSRLLDAVSLEEFKERHWENQPLLVRRHDGADFNRLLTLEDVDRLLSSDHGRGVRVVNNGKEIPLRRTGSRARESQERAVDTVYSQFAGGATIVLQAIHERQDGIRGLSRALARDLSASIQVNAYLTPPHQQGLGPHYDTHDVFVLQTEGSKHWRIYQNTPTRLPLRGQPYAGNGEVGPVLMEFELAAGDTLYVPRGFVHEARGTATSSLHLTIGIHPITWAAVLLEAVEGAIRSDWRLRQSLPIGFATDRAARERTEESFARLVGVMNGHLDATRSVDNAIQAVQFGEHGSDRGRLLDIDALPRLDLNTRVYRREGVGPRVEDDSERLRVFFNGKQIEFPAFVAGMWDFVATNPSFTATDLPGDTDDEGKLVFARTLVREGVLSLFPDSAEAD